MQQQATGKYRWTICALVFFGTTVHYPDRPVIRLLKTNLEKEFFWTETEFANIVVAFQFWYAAGLLFAGRCIPIAKLVGGLFDFYKTAGSIETGYYIMFFIFGFAYLLA